MQIIEHRVKVKTTVSINQYERLIDIIIILLGQTKLHKNRFTATQHNPKAQR